MAQQGMFGNYQQQIADETALRRQQSQTGGLTGWAAITNAMSGIGSEIGYAGGQAMGGMTPVQAEQARFESVMDSVNYDPTDPNSMMEASAALNAAGFYDKGLEMFNLSNKIKSDNLLVEIKEIELDNLKNPKKEMITLGDGRVYYRDTLELVKPDLEIDLDKNKTAAMLKYERNQEASKYRNTVLKDLPSNTLEEKRVLLTALDNAGYRDTAVFTGLQSTVTSVANTERLVNKDVQTDIEQETLAEVSSNTQEYKGVLTKGDGMVYVNELFRLKGEPKGSSDEEELAIGQTLGKFIEVYDEKLARDANEGGLISPSKATEYYQRILARDDVYQADQSNFTNPITGEFSLIPTARGAFVDTERFTTVLDTTFGREDKFVSFDEVDEYIGFGLVIPGVTIVEVSPGQKRVLTAQQIKKRENAIDVPIQ